LIAGGRHIGLSDDGNTTLRVRKSLQRRASPSCSYAQ